MSPLSRTVELRPGETPRSLVSRLAAMNGISTAHQFSKDMGLDLRGIDNSDPDSLEKLAGYSGVAVTELETSSIRKTGNGIFLGGQLISRRATAKSFFRFCPHCLIEDIVRGPENKPEARAWLRASWSVPQVRTCHIHRNLLVTLNASENHSIRNDIAALMKRRSDEVHRLATAARALAYSPLADYAASRLAGGEDKSDLLGVLPFYLAIKLCEMVGATLRIGRTFTWNGLREEDRVAAGATGFEFISDGREAFLKFLELHYSDWSRVRARGAKGLAASFFAWLQDGRKNPDMEPLREMVRTHALGHLPLGPGDEFLGTIMEPRKVHSVYSAHLEYDIHPKRLKKLLLQNGIISEEQASLSDLRILFDAGEALPLLQDAAEEISGNNAREYLGMNRTQWEQVQVAGFIKPLLGDGPGTRLSHSKARLDRFLASIRYEKGSSGDLVPLSQCIKLASCGYADVVRLLQGNQLERVSVDPEHAGFAGVLVDASEVSAKVQRKALPGLTARQVAEKLGVVLGTAQALIKNGDLPSTPYQVYANSTREARLVQPDDVEAFAAEHISLKELAEKIGSEGWPRRAGKLLADMGIEPVFTVQSHRSVIFRRADALSTLSRSGHAI
ncbi:TniQ family protein [Roseibium sp. FZY0029]|uniref:TniQ family protein n=1 Tax=Roseibium sp. FZY0029 TaxID=3116647 RepID=UPI002E9832F8|nr:TniQ family protein [Roseibium sp. FZY0029]